MVLDQEYVFLKTNVIKSERRLLKELGFCVHVKHPHKVISLFVFVVFFLLHFFYSWKSGHISNIRE